MASRISPLQHFSNTVYLRFKKAGYQELSLGAISGLTLWVWLDYTFGKQITPRSLDKLKICWLHKNRCLEGLSEKDKVLAYEKALDKGDYPEHLLPYYKTRFSLEKGEEESFKEFFEELKKTLHSRTWQEKERGFESSYQKTYKKDRLYSSSIESNCIALATFLNYWQLIITKSPVLVKSAAASSRYLLKYPFSHPLETSLSAYATQNFLAMLYEILDKMGAIDDHALWVKRLKKISKLLSVDSDLFFLKKDRKVIYAIIQLFLPFLLIQTFRLAKKTPYNQGLIKLKALKRRSSSLPTPSYSLRCLHPEDKAVLDNFCACRSQRMAVLSFSSKDLTMKALKDFQDLKDLESLINEPSPHLMYVDPKKVRSAKDKKALFMSFKKEVSKVNHSKRQVILLIEGSSSGDLIADKLFQQFLQGIEEHSPKCLLIGDKREEIDSIQKVLLPTYTSNKTTDLHLTLPIGELIKNHYSSHPLAQIISEYSNANYFEGIFENVQLGDEELEQKGVQEVLKKVDESLKAAEEEFFNDLKIKGLKKYYQQNLKLIRKIQRLEVCKKRCFTEALALFKESDSKNPLDIHKIVARQEFEELYLRKQTITLFLKTLREQRGALINKWKSQSQ